LAFPILNRYIGSPIILNYWEDWAWIGNGLVTCPPRAFAFEDLGYAFVGTETCGVFRSLDPVSGWEVVNTGEIEAIGKPKYLYCCFLVFKKTHQQSNSSKQESLPLLTNRSRRLMGQGIDGFFYFGFGIADFGFFQAQLCGIKSLNCSITQSPNLKTRKGFIPRRGEPTIARMAMLLSGTQSLNR
jgi:hypothetical protein